MAVSPGPWSRAHGLAEVREAWAREQVRVSQLHTQVSLACPDAPVSSLPKVQLVLEQGWSARQSRRGGPAPRTSALHSPLFWAVSGPVQVTGDSCALPWGRPLYAPGA